MTKTITPMKQWLSAATADERRALAQRAITSEGQLYQLAGGHRQASSDLAGRIEAVSLEMHKATKGRLPKLLRTDLCEACRQCQYAAKCLGEAQVVRSEFPILEMPQ
jgi:hypothetical protein